MRFYSTKDRNRFFTLAEAVLKGLPDDNGLFMPESIPQLPPMFFKELKNYSFTAIAFEVAKAFLRDDIPENELEKIVGESINFSAPVIAFDENTFVLELFHGPTLAFKDFGARFMARLMTWLNRNENKKLTILVATSGDTGSAVAHGFYEADGIDVVILYPSGKVSPLQEKQLTTLGKNIAALEIDGTFDDCQRLVKAAFLDSSLSSKLRLASANSINIARLLPQSFYYIEAWKQVNQNSPVAFSVPSGNFGNITAGLLAKRMGLPVAHFIASVNSNDVFPSYLQSGNYHPKPSELTISNAMDVGAPSNFARIMDLYNNSRDLIKQDISSWSFSDGETKNAMKEVYHSFNYMLDPHGAVGYLGCKAYQQQRNSQCIILETAHPAKFIDVVEDTLSVKVNIPGSLSALAEKEKKSILLSSSYDDFKAYMSSR